MGTENGMTRRAMARRMPANQRRSRDILGLIDLKMKTKKERIEEIKLAVESGITDRSFWHSRTPEERLWAMELMRRRIYGYDETSMPRLQRVLEVRQLKRYDTPDDS